MPIQFLRPRETAKRLAISHSALFAMEQCGLMPPRVKIGPRAAAHVEHEITAIQQARIAGADDADIRALVRKLLQERQR